MKLRAWPVDPVAGILVAGLESVSYRKDPDPGGYLQAE
jgi:hypothetical protein